ncbi:MAG TPA: NAD(P)-dependent oxidoreductase [Spirochaetia bacterium]|nr:NAD(P)-dependent oxidoreductase [Spirochaetia bacterium]
MKVGFIGLGIMGSRMAANVIRNGHELSVFNRTRERCLPLIALGAKAADTAADAAREVPVVITMLADPDAVREAAAGATGFLTAMRKNAIWIDCSTVNPEFTRQMAAEANSHGVRFVDAPVAGSKGPAERGELTVLVGGSEKNVQEVRPLLDSIGKKVIHVGDNGMGTSMKMVINLMLANAMASYGEALALGKALGIPADRTADALVGGPVCAPFLAAKRPKVENGDYDAEFPLRLMRKDLHLAALEAFEHGISLPVTNAVKELYGMAVQRGWSDEDFAAVCKVFGL